MDLKGTVLKTLFRRWPPGRELRDGYTIQLPSPMDIPFLLRFALEGLRHMETTHCRQILVVPDGWGRDGGARLRRAIDGFDDDRIELVRLRWRDYAIIRCLRPPGSSGTHWQLALNGTKNSTARYALLHDADAFHLDADAIERQYRQCVDNGMHTLGVEARWDPFFREIGYRIPGTWELMYSIEWARRHSPYRHKGRTMQTPHGVNTFDSMLYPQYLDYGSGRVGVMDQPPAFVHFSGAVHSYRVWRERQQRRRVTHDLMHRLLWLAMMEQLMPAPDGERQLPTLDQLRRGLTDPEAPVRYDRDEAIRNYGEFRQMMDRLCECPVFRGERAERIREMLEPWDEHAAQRIEQRPELGEGPVRKFRRHALDDSEVDPQPAPQQSP